MTAVMLLIVIKYKKKLDGDRNTRSPMACERQFNGTWVTKYGASILLNEIINVND